MSASSFRIAGIFQKKQRISSRIHLGRVKNAGMRFHDAQLKLHREGRFTTPLHFLIPTASLSRRWFSSEIDSILEPTARKPEKEAKTKVIQQQGKTQRWYKEVTVAPYDGANNRGYQIYLDGRIVKTPGDNRLLIPTPQLAQAIAVEWDRQGKAIIPSDMPFMSLACTAIDEMPIKRTMCVDRLLSFLKTDPVTVRDPKKELRDLQKATHEPLVLWLAQHYNVPRLRIGTELIHPDMPEETMVTIQWNLFGQDDWILTGLDVLTQNLRSFVLAAAVWKRRITPAEALFASRLEEYYQTQQQGVVEGGHDVEEAIIEAEVTTANFFIQNLK